MVARGEGGGGGGRADAILGAAPCSFFVSAGCAASDTRYKLSKGMEVVDMDGWVEIEDMAEVIVEMDSEIAHSTLIPLAKVWLVRGIGDDEVGVSAGLTTM